MGDDKNTIGYDINLVLAEIMETVMKYNEDSKNLGEEIYGILKSIFTRKSAGDNLSAMFYGLAENVSELAKFAVLADVQTGGSATIIATAIGAGLNLLGLISQDPKDPDKQIFPQILKYYELQKKEKLNSDEVKNLNDLTKMLRYEFPEAKTDENSLDLNKVLQAYLSRYVEKTINKLEKRSKFNFQRIDEINNRNLLGQFEFHINNSRNNLAGILKKVGINIEDELDTSKIYELNSLDEIKNSLSKHGELKNWEEHFDHLDYNFQELQSLKTERQSLEEENSFIQPMIELLKKTDISAITFKGFLDKFNQTDKTPLIEKIEIKNELKTNHNKPVELSNQSIVTEEKNSNNKEDTTQSISEPRLSKKIQDDNLNQTSKKEVIENQSEELQVELNDKALILEEKVAIPLKKVDEFLENRYEEKEFEEPLKYVEIKEVVKQNQKEELQNFKKHLHSVDEKQKKNGQILEAYDYRNNTKYAQSLDDGIKKDEKNIFQLKAKIAEDEDEIASKELIKSYSDQIKLIQEGNLNLEDRIFQIKTLKEEIDSLKNEKIKSNIQEYFDRDLEKIIAGYQNELEFSEILSGELNPEMLNYLLEFAAKIERLDFAGKQELSNLVSQTINTTQNSLLELANDSGEGILAKDSETFGSRKEQLKQFYSNGLELYKDNEAMKQLLLQLYFDQEQQLIEKQNQTKLLLASQFYDTYNQIVNSKGEEIGNTVGQIFKDLLIKLATEKLVNQISDVFTQQLPGGENGELFSSLTGALMGIGFGLLFRNNDESSSINLVNSSGWSYNAVDYAKSQNQYSPPVTNESTKIFYFNTYIQNITTEAANQLVTNTTEFRKMWNTMMEDHGRKLTKGIY